MSRINILKHEFTGTGSDNTPEGALIRRGGKHTRKTITLSANNTSASENIYTVTGTVLVMGLHAEVTDATTLTNCTDIYFDVWDGTNSVVLSKITGSNISGYNVGAFIVKDQDITQGLSTANNDQVRVTEPSGKEIFHPFLVTAKTGATTYLRFRYTTTDAPINAQLRVGIEWADIDSGTITAV